MTDYTGKPKSERISKCPKCGRNGLHRKYKDGDAAFIHKTGYEGNVVMVKEYCLVKPMDETQTGGK